MGEFKSLLIKHNVTLKSEDILMNSVIELFDVDLDVSDLKGLCMW